MALRSIFEAVVGRRVIPPVPPGRLPSVPGEEVDVPAPRPGKASGLALFITYENAVGERSERRIACRRFDSGSGQIQAWCFERRAFRSFRTDRITEACCLETGEVLNLSQLIDDLRVRGLPVQDGRLARYLTVLTFLMRCDGEAHPLEAAQVEKAVTSFAFRFDGNDHMIGEGVTLARRLAPEAQDFARALNWLQRCADRASLSRLIMAQAANVIDADGHHADEEIVFARELSGYLHKLTVE